MVQIHLHKILKRLKKNRQTNFLNKIIMKKIYLFLLLLTIGFTVKAQENYKQTLRGRVIDAQTEFPIAGALVLLNDENPPVATMTDSEGEFRFENVALGRQTLRVRLIGYLPVTLNNLELISGKEMVLNIKMEEQIIETEEVIVKAFARKDKTVNEMTLVIVKK